MLWMALIIGLATPSGPIPSVSFRAPGTCDIAYDAKVGQPLEFTSETYAQSCAPGGPCSVLARSPRPVDGYVVRVPGCDRPIRGRIKKTKRSCDGLPVWRFTGKLVPGHVYRVDDGDASRAQTRAVAGKPRPLKCGKKWVPSVLRESRMLDRTPREVVISRDALNVKPTDDGKGTQFSWAGPDDLQLLQPARLILPERGADEAFAPGVQAEGGYKAKVHVRGSTIYVQTTTREGATCAITKIASVTLFLDETDIRLGGQLREHSELAEACPPLPPPIKVPPAPPREPGEPVGGRR